MDKESGKSTEEEETGAGKGKSETEKSVWGWQREMEWIRETVCWCATKKLLTYPVAYPGFHSEEYKF